ncbi:BLUF domain-containing protein [Aurantiacibacter spongiae]|nr:BLUF domain-containing protein [Aurantiacibacter spongiae]
MSRLLYISQSNLVDGERSVQEQVHEIARSSADRNRKVGLTGSLLFVDNHFIQVLEGDTATIETVFERICCDFDHREVKLIDLVPVKDRLFGHWHMAVMSEDDDTVLPLRDELQHIRFLVGVNAWSAVDQMRECLQMRTASERQLVP